MTDPFPPPLSCDCHVHVAGPKARYPLSKPRAYTPMDAPVEALEAMLARLGLDRVVIVQMSVFGTDNACMIDALHRLGARARGVVMADADTPGETLDGWHRAGVRGIRVNLHTLGRNDPDEARGRIADAARLCARNGWHVQLWTTAPTIEALAGELATLPVPLVIDHFGVPSPAEPDSGPERAIRKLLSAGNTWVKISGTYRLSPSDDPTATAALARRVHAENPERIVWGSDWPHSPPHQESAVEEPPEAPYRDLDTAALLDTVRQWFPEPARWREILVHNPARLYGF